MTRVFLKLYLLLILPLVLITMLPQSPINMLADWWNEKAAYHEYGAIYPLIKEELDLIPKSDWVAKVESISEHFAYPLFIKKRTKANLKQEEFDKLDTKGYALIKHNFNNTLAFSVEHSDYVLYASLYSRTTNQEEFEKNTRGYRYFINKKIRNSIDPIEEFNKSIKKHSAVDLKMYSLEELKNSEGDKKFLTSLIKK